MKRKNLTERGKHLLVHQDKDERLGAAVEIHRDARCSNVVNIPQTNWIYQMNRIATSDAGRVTFVMRPTFRPGLSGNHGCVLTIVAGKINGDEGNGTSIRRPIKSEELPHYGGTDSLSPQLIFQLGIEDAIQFHHQFGRVIKNAKLLTQKENKKNMVKPKKVKRRH